MSTHPPKPCKWKPPLTKKGPEKTETVHFNCRFPDVELTPEFCQQCLLGDLFTLQYTQFMNLKQGFAFQQEMMAYLKSITDDGSFEDLK